jgi:hypothetical protein
LTCQRNIDDAQIYHIVKIAGPQTGEQNWQPPRTTALLVYAVAILNVMPQSGLEEAVRSLREIYDYHLLPPPPPRLLLSSPRSTLKAKMNPAKVQASFQVTEDQ